MIGFILTMILAFLWVGMSWHYWSLLQVYTVDNPLYIWIECWFLFSLLIFSQIGLIIAKKVEVKK